MNVRTSASDPIRVDWLALDERIAGRIGLTFAPGKIGRSIVGGHFWQRDLATDLTRLRDHHGVSLLVSLVEDTELAAYRIEPLYTMAAACGLDVLRLPVADTSVPRSRAAVHALCTAIVRRARTGARVVIHCIGGRGRTGTVAGCVLVELGFTAGEALALLATARGPDCPENARQRRFIAAHAAPGR